MKRFFSKYRLLVIALILAALVVVIDRLTEQAVSLYLQDTGGFVKVTPFFNLVWTGNDGISFGMLQGLAYGKWLLSAFAFIITGFFFIWLLRTQSLWVSVALGLIIGGALGNTFERLAYGHVIDILDFHAYGYHWPAFNITDSAIVSGIALLMFYEFFKAPEHQKIRGTNNG
ncbi:MAG: signal peptidase II [Alphaproteobacteria bacterium]|nr:signal peptidase II [Alphaproteobacteria bacterium]|tara:strand:+ start:1583 stop:2098 length:516 start_codon:yes stop_codon:yes gene_type:complete